MYRTITEDILKWKNSLRRKPLVVSGVRQCGKTYLLKKFGKEHFENTVYLNFEENERISSIFEYDYDVNRIVEEIEMAFGCRIEDGKTLLVFDEIQKCSRAVTSLKYFCENRSNLHVACAGSLLGLEMRKEGTSFPVGKVDMLKMYPMSFDEFCQASGQGNAIKAIIKMDRLREIPSLYTGPLEKELKLYYIIGGMPEVVSVWCETHDFDEVKRIQNMILTGYRNDFAKHAPAAEVPKINWIWDSLPKQLAKENNKFIFNQVKEGKRARDLEDALQWLIDAGLCYKLEKVETPEIPLKYSADSTYFKLYACDVGLLSSMVGIDPMTVIRGNEYYERFKGAIAENYVMQQLTANRIKPYFWRSGNSAEVDFLIDEKNRCVPIEVKAAENTKAKSFTLFCKRYNPEIGIRSSLKNVGDNTINETVVYSIPLYSIFKIREYIK